MGAGTGTVERVEPLSVEDVYRAHAAGLVALARLLVDDLASAEEVVQDAFVGLLLRERRVGSPEDALAYVRAAVVNRSRSRLRRRRTERAHVVPEAVPDASAEAQALRLIEAQELRAQLATLPRRQREVVVLRYTAGLSEAQIAAALGISAGSVKTHASRALHALGSRLAEEE